MPNIQQIVVPINGTAESFKALSLASDLAKNIPSTDLFIISYILFHRN